MRDPKKLMLQGPTNLALSTHTHTQALCTRMTEGHSTACAVAQKEFEELRSFLAAHNDSMLEAARQKYAAAVADAMVRGE